MYNYSGSIYDTSPICNRLIVLGILILVVLLDIPLDIALDPGEDLAYFPAE